MEKTEYQKKKERAKNKAWRETLKRNHQCVKCTKTDEHTLAGFTMCKVCNDKRNAVYHRWRHTEHGKRVNRAKRKRLSYRRAKNGVCVRCGQNTPESGKLCCTTCLNRAKELYYKTKEKKKTCG